MNKSELLQQYAGDLRETPRRSGLVLARIGELIERAGSWLQDNAAELQWRKVRAMRRWGQ